MIILAVAALLLFSFTAGCSDAANANTEPDPDENDGIDSGQLPDNITDSPTTPPVINPTPPAATPPTEPEQIETIDKFEDILSYYTDFLSDRANNRFIRFEFSTKEEIDLSLVFYDGFMLKDSDGEYYYAYNISDEERAALKEILDNETDYGFMGLDITRVYVPEAIEFLCDMTGYEFSREELGASLNASGHVWIYMENWDSYYHEHGDTAYRLVTCVDVIELDNGQTEIYYHYADGAEENAVLTIQEIDGRIVFLSNRYL